MKLVVVNADDFGASPRINLAVERAHREGILTSASLMTAEPGFDEAVAVARASPTLGVGLHVTVTCDRALLPHSRIPHLVDLQGRFRPDPLRAGLVYSFSRAARGELRCEMEAQFERFAATGMPWSHADGHQHCHLQPAVWEIFAEMCERYGVRRVRIPREPLRTHLRAGGVTPLVNTGATLILQLLCRRSRRLLRSRAARGAASVFCCGQVHGVYQTGRMTAEYTGRLLGELPDGASEIYFHPGSDHAHRLPSDRRRDGVEDVEMEALLDPEVRARFDSLAIRRVTYAGADSAGASPPQ